MHELSLCRSLLRIIDNKLAELGGAASRRVTRVWLEISALSGIDPAGLQFYFPLVAQHSVAAGAILQIAVLPEQADCLVCERRVAIECFTSCPQCGAYGLMMQKSGELMIKKMEIS